SGDRDFLAEWTADTFVRCASTSRSRPLKTRNSDEARKTWECLRANYESGKVHFPSLAQLLPVIEFIRESGYWENLYAWTSHDNLLISPHPKWWVRRGGSILVIPKETAVE